MFTEEVTEKDEDIKTSFLNFFFLIYDKKTILFFNF